MGEEEETKSKIKSLLERDDALSELRERKEKEEEHEEGFPQNS